MRTRVRRPLFLSARRTIALLRRRLTAELKPAGLNLDALEGGRESLIRSLPAWVRQFGFLAGAGQYCLWCEPRPAPRQTFPSQIILEITPGRYLVDILDTATQTWISRESAEGGPLVAGLPCTGSPLLVWIRVLDF